MRNVLRGTIINKVLTNSNTEYPEVLPEGCSRFIVQARANDVRMAYRAGDVADATSGTYVTIKAAQPPHEHNDVSNPTGTPRTLYFASTSGGAVVEIEVWGG